MNKIRLYKKAIEETIKRNYHSDKFGTDCSCCNSYTPIQSKAIEHERGCFVKHLERIVSI